MSLGMTVFSNYDEIFEDEELIYETYEDEEIPLSIFWSEPIAGGMSNVHKIAEMIFIVLGGIVCALGILLIRILVPNLGKIR